MEDDSGGVVARDFLTLILMGFMLLVVAMLPHLQPPTEDGEVDALGTVTVNIYWPPESRSDIDLWMQSPGDRPVGYSRKSGAVLDLLRDDLGQVNDPTSINHEFIGSRGSPPGEYTVNVHSFRQTEPALPVYCEIRMRTPGGDIVTVHSSEVILTRQGEEITVIRFRLDVDGKVVSRTTLPKPLRTVR